MIECAQCGDQTNPYGLAWYAISEPPFVHKGMLATYTVPGPLIAACPVCEAAIDGGRAGGLALRSLGPDASPAAQAEIVEMAAGLIGRLTKIPRPSTEE